MYDPVLGRFTARDPITGTFKNPMTLHAYLYCINDPINYVDPSGEFLGFLGGFAGDMWMRAKDLTASLAVKSCAEETLLGGLSVWNGTIQGYINMLFLDFTVRKVGLKELWMLKWHNRFDISGAWTTIGGVEPGDWPEWMRSFKDY